MERSQAEQLEQANKSPAGVPAAIPEAKRRAGPVQYAVFGEGDLTFQFTDWLHGTAHVIVDQKGCVTVIGKITPQKEFTLFEQKDYVRQLFKLEARASYGIPVVGNIFIFANVGMDAFAKLGPAKFYNIVIEGTYSTDPTKARNFSIRGSLNISAAAGLRLRGEAGAGLEILAHDIKAGAGINAIAGIKGYAEATPIVGYREQAAAGQDKKGEFFIRGELEIAAQPFLGLAGDLFVEIDAPWWSPVPDKKWTWPLVSKEWPIGGSFGLGASVDYVFGSGQLPKLDFKPVEFSADKFMTDLYSDKSRSGSGERSAPGKWQEKNSKAADPPAKTSPKGNATAGKAAALPAAKSRPVSSRKSGRPVDPNARTKEGKTVKQLQDEAAKKGKAPKGKERAKDGATGAARPERDAGAVKSQQRQVASATRDHNRGATFAGGQHTLRGHITATSVDFLIASGDFGPIQQKLNQISDAYLNEHTGRFVTSKESAAAAALRKHIGTIDPPTGMLGVIRTARRSIIAAKDNPERQDELIEDTLEKLQVQIGQMGEYMVANFGSVLEGGGNTAIGATILWRTRNRALVVTRRGIIIGEIEDGIRTRRAGQFGIEADDNGKPVRFSYHEFNDTWAAAPSRPAYQISIGSGPGPHTRFVILQSAPVSGGEPPKISLSHLSSYGSTYAKYVRRGHLIAAMFGGTGDWNNIVPMTFNANQSQMLSIETTVRNILPSVPGLTTIVVRYSITPNYVPSSAASAHLPPVSLIVQVEQVWPLAPGAKPIVLLVPPPVNNT